MGAQWEHMGALQSSWHPLQQARPDGLLSRPLLSFWNQVCQKRTEDFLDWSLICKQCYPSRCVIWKMSGEHTIPPAPHLQHLFELTCLRNVKNMICEVNGKVPPTDHDMVLLGCDACQNIMACYHVMNSMTALVSCGAMRHPTLPAVDATATHTFPSSF